MLHPVDSFHPMPCPHLESFYSFDIFLFLVLTQKLTYNILRLHWQLHSRSLLASKMIIQFNKKIPPKSSGQCFQCAPSDAHIRSRQEIPFCSTNADLFGVIVNVSSELLKHQRKAKRRKPAYSRVLAEQGMLVPFSQFRLNRPVSVQTYPRPEKSFPKKSDLASIGSASQSIIT